MLVPCPACDRHVRATEPACPFCNEALSVRAVPTANDARNPLRRVPRAAMLTLGATIALTGCGATVGPDGGTDVVDEEVRYLPLYGAAPFDAATSDTANADTATTDAQPMIDATDDTADAVDEEAGIFPLYGAPPLPDVVDP